MSIEIEWVLFPGETKKVRYVSLMCDECWTWTTGWNDTAAKVRSMYAPHGWTRKNRKDLCGDCSKEDKP